MRRLTVLVVVAVLSVACSPGGPAEDASGEEIYIQLCARCHGADMSGGVGPPLGPGSNAASESDEFLEFTIMNGRGRMPSFSSTLEVDQVERLIGYMREVQDR